MGVAAGIYAALAHQLGLWTFTWLVMLALLSMLAFSLARVPERNLGHRAGGKGFRGEPAEGMPLLSWASRLACVLDIIVRAGSAACARVVQPQCRTA